MSAKDPFTDMNPFLRLNIRDLPRCRSPRIVHAGKNQQKQDDKLKSAQDEESLPFLQAVHALPLKKKTSSETSTLQDEHARDFVSAMRDVRPLANKGRDVPRNVEPPAVLESQQPSFQSLLENTLEFALNFSKEYAEGHVVGLDSLILQKLRAGQYSPEAHLDLHGLNARQAFDALVGFVRRSWHRSMRTLLLIPGRGKNSPDGVAILRARVQSWLTQDPLKRVVLAFCTARPVDGGPGSLYVLLRKYKKKGKVHWERGPVDLDL